AAALAPYPSIVLAVSGGRDSVVLLDAAVAVAAGRVRVATFDHGTGAAATAAVRHVRPLAPRAGLAVAARRAAGPVAAAAAAARGLAWVDDPSNLSRRPLRNRVRHELLPALHAADPGLGQALLAAARCAAECRATVDALAEALGLAAGEPTEFDDGLPVAALG